MRRSKGRWWSKAWFATIALAPAPLLAQAATTDPSVHSLTDAQKAEILSHNRETLADAARLGVDTPGGADRAIHGEVGAMIGSNGTRGAFGTAAIPLGGNAGAIVSFESSRYGGRR